MSHDQKDGQRADLKGSQARKRQRGEKGLSAQRGRAQSRVHEDQRTGARKQQGAQGETLGAASPAHSCPHQLPPAAEGRRRGP